jgi:hypothetical protein
MIGPLVKGPISPIKFRKKRGAMNLILMLKGLLVNCRRHMIDGHDNPDVAILEFSLAISLSIV